MNEILHYDIFEIIFEKIIKSSNFKTLLNFRLLNKDTNFIFITYCNKIKPTITPSRLFIDLRNCMACNNETIITNRDIIIYNYDKIPHKCLIFCRSIDCKLKSLKRYFLNCKRNKVYISYEILNEQIIIDYINRANKYYYFKKFINETLRYIGNKYYIKCELYYLNENNDIIFSYIEKYIEIPTEYNKYIKINKNLQNIKLFN